MSHMVLQHPGPQLPTFGGSGKFRWLKLVKSGLLQRLSSNKNIFKFTYA